MSASPLGLVEMAMSFCLPIGWGLWELRKLRREQKRDAEKAATEARSSSLHDEH